MKKTISLMLAVMMLISSMLITTATAEEAPTKLVIYNNSGRFSATSLLDSADEDLAMVHDYILKELNLDVQVIIPPQDNATAKLNAMLGGGEQIDLFWGSWMDYEDIATDLTDILKEYGQNILANWGPFMSNATNTEGKWLGIPRSVMWRTYPTWIRVDIFEKLGLDPEMNSIEDLEAALYEIKAADPVGNGQTIPFLTNYDSINYGLSAAFTGEGYGWNYDEENDKMYHSIETEGYRDMVEKMAQWYKDGIMYAESFVNDASTEIAMTKDGRTAVLLVWYSRMSVNGVPYINEAVPEAHYEYIRGFHGDNGLAETMSKSDPSCSIIPKSSPNAVEVIKLLDWCQNPYNFAVTEYGIEDVHWRETESTNGLFTIEVFSDVGYVGDYSIAEGVVMEVQLGMYNSPKAYHLDFLRNDCLDFTDIVAADDTYVCFNTNDINDAVPTRGDINTMMKEGVVAFITGTRDMSEWDNFIDELNAIGLQDLDAEYCRQYDLYK